MQLFNRNRERDVPEIEIQGDEAVVPEIDARDQSGDEPGQSGRRRIAIPKLKWWN